MASPVSFRPLCRGDLPRMHGWLAQPHVVEWWHETLDMAGVEAKYLPCIDGSEPTHVFIIEHGSRAIGWIQWYRWTDYSKHAALLGAEPGTAGIDLAIGETDAIGLGIGSAALRAFVETIVFADPTITACISDPETRNLRSLGAFDNAGFTVVRPVRIPQESFTRQIVRRDRPR
jgi:aminoglycoside 6'-N-acetyltransferase